MLDAVSGIIAQIPAAERRKAVDYIRGAVWRRLGHKLPAIVTLVATAVATGAHSAYYRNYELGAVSATVLAAVPYLGLRSVAKEAGIRIRSLFHGGSLFADTLGRCVTTGQVGELIQKFSDVSEPPSLKLITLDPEPTSPTTMSAPTDLPPQPTTAPVSRIKSVPAPQTAGTSVLKVGDEVFVAPNSTAPAAMAASAVFVRITHVTAEHILAEDNLGAEHAFRLRLYKVWKLV